MPRNPRTASQSSAGEAVRRWSAHGAAPLEYFADISSCDMISSVQKGHARGTIQGTYQVPSATNINVPTAQLLAANGPISSRQYVYRASAPDTERKTGKEGGARVPTLMPRTTPTPTPLAIPLKRLFRAHGISPMRSRSSRGDNLY